MHMDQPPTDRNQRKQQKKQQKLQKLQKKLSSLTTQDNKSANQKDKNIALTNEEEFVRTQPGDFKLMQDLKTYDPSYVEHGWYAWWEKMDFFNEESNKFHYENPIRDKFVMILPPPNITGKLHIGHAMMLAIQDALVRYNRLMGKEVVFVPGYDHAGIATQNVVEKTLERIQKEGFNENDDFERNIKSLLTSKGVNQEDNYKEISNLDRNTLKEITYIWSDVYKSNILNQLKKLGTSLNFNRTKFTMDESINKLVEDSFIKLYNKGLIYRDYRLVNWSMKLKTTLSDLEVNNIEINDICVYSTKIHTNMSEVKTLINEGRESCIQGVIYTLRYPIIKKSLIININQIVADKMLDKDILEVTHESLKPKNKPEIKIDLEYEKLNKLYIPNKKIKETILKSKSINKIYLKTLKEIEYIEIVTKRPETIFGDTALCYNPKDNKYKYLKDYLAINPLTLQLIPIIADEMAKIDFGTGILKITPSCDFNDYLIYKKHSLEFIKVINEEGNLILNEELNRFEVRRLLIDYFSNNMLLEISKSPQILPICSRSNCIVEPLPKNQWWMAMKETAEKTLRAKLKIFPKESIKIFENWLLEIRDWCLSRQLWWGHQIPAYKVSLINNNEDKSIGDKGDNNEDKSIGDKGDNNEDKSIGDKGDNKERVLGWIVCKKEDILQKAKETYNLNNNELNKIKYKQDRDVLDTWFSSGLWPFAVFNEKERDLYFPNSLLETGNDILFFWVARMCFLSIELFNKLPFNEVLLHGIVRDKFGRKMSKSLGNVIDPISLINGITLKELNKSLSLTLNKKERTFAIENQKVEFKEGIKKCGSDALRLSLVNMYSGTRDINLDIKRVEGYRKYGNKIWNGMKCLKYLLRNITNDNPNKFIPQKINDSNKFILQKINDSNILKKFILQKIREVIKIQHEKFKIFDLMEASKSLYEFSYVFFDTFLELLKGFCSLENLFTGLRVYKEFSVMLSVYMPFLAEEIFQQCILMEDELMKEFKGELNSFGFKERDFKEVSVCIARYPSVEVSESPSVENNSEEVDLFIEMIKEAENMRSKNLQIAHKKFEKFEKELRILTKQKDVIFE